MTGDYPAAAASLTRALELYRGLGDRLGQASVLDNLGGVGRETGDYPAAAASHRQALALYRDLDHQAGQAQAINNLGSVQAWTGDYPAAAGSYEQALAIFRDIGHRLGQALATGNLGVVQSWTGDYAPLQEALALEGIGHCLLQDGEPGDAAAHWQQALAIYERIGVPDARRIREILRQHGITTAPPPPGGESRQPGAPTVL